MKYRIGDMVLLNFDGDYLWGRVELGCTTLELSKIYNYPVKIVGAVEGRAITTDGRYTTALRIQVEFYNKFTWWIPASCVRSVKGSQLLFEFAYE